jgi:hypothetical protein
VGYFHRTEWAPFDHFSTHLAQTLHNSPCQRMRESRKRAVNTPQQQQQPRAFKVCNFKEFFHTALRNFQRASERTKFIHIVIMQCCKYNFAARERAE